MELIVACVVLLLQYMPLRSHTYTSPTTEQILSARSSHVEFTRSGMGCGLIYHFQNYRHEDTIF